MLLQQLAAAATAAPAVSHPSTTHVCGQRYAPFVSLHHLSNALNRPSGQPHTSSSSIALTFAPAPAAPYNSPSSGPQLQPQPNLSSAPKAFRSSR